VSNLGLVDIRASGRGWFVYTIAEQYSLKIRHLSTPLRPEDLMGFNNTGNICVWPSEEVLAYYALRLKENFKGKSVLELGGGMTCLAGVFLAKYSPVSLIHLTDGNPASVENVKMILEENDLVEGGHVSCSTLEWGDCSSQPQRQYDVLLAADCLFFDDSRKDLVMTMWKCMKADGVALVTAPRRGRTLDMFLAQAVESGFVFSLTEYYNPQVWERHVYMQSDSPHYDADIHYPLLINLSKKKLI
jgi:calmodulin-lysine N-methyltransferase